MKVRISTLPPEGAILTEKLPLETLNARMAEGRDNSITFTSPPEAVMQVHKTATGAEAKGCVKATCKQPCSRCAMVVEHGIEAHASFSLLPIPADADPDSTFEDDIGLSYYHGDHVELDRLVEEALILQTSLYWRPEEDLQGKCTQCGLDKSVLEDMDDKAPKTQLGNLLKKAGVKLNEH